jgi:hypothetical protein
LNAFGVVSGGRGLCHLINLATATAAWYFFRAYVIPPDAVKYFGPLSMFAAVLSAGFFAPTAFVSTFFIGFCSQVFTEPGHYDLEASDRHGGFRALGDLATWSYVLVLLVPFAIPVGVISDLLFSSQQTALITVGASMVSFWFFCLFTAGLIPILLLHRSMSSSRRKHLEERFDELINRLKQAKLSGKDACDVSSLVGFLADWELFKQAQATSDWPVDAGTSAKIITAGAIYVPGVANFLVSLPRLVGG